MNIDVALIVGLVISLLTIAGALIAAVRWLVHHYFEEIKHELKPNSGASMKDQVTRMDLKLTLMEESHKEIKEDNKKMEENIKKIYETLLAYVTKG